MASIEERTLNWVMRVVIGLNLCPFANAVVKSDNLAICIEASNDVSVVLTSLVTQCETVLRASEQFTMLMVLPNGFANFDDYLDMLELARSLLVELELDEHLQLACFHPYYQFSDTSCDDASNFTNRSPYPMLHILQEAAVAKAIEAHPDTTTIPHRNIELFRSMEPDQLKLLLTDEIDANET